jgi:hypothetical protein
MHRVAQAPAIAPRLALHKLRLPSTKVVHATDKHTQASLTAKIDHLWQHVMFNLRQAQWQQVQTVFARTQGAPGCLYRCCTAAAAAAAAGGASVES